jgi:hypothetical protein
MSFQPFSESDAARFREFAGLFAQCRQTFRDTVNETAEWRPSPGSIAAQDREAALRDDSQYAESNGGLPALVVIPFLFVASEQLGALGALYEREEVLVPSGACMRSALEHCAHVLWVLQRADTEPFEQRLARALLEMLRSVEERKIVVCNLFGDGSPECAQWKERFIAEKQRIKGSFPDGLTYDRHLPVLLEQKVPGSEAAVAWMFEFVIDRVTTEVGKGVYGFLANLSHPTVDAIMELWGKRPRAEEQQRQVEYVVLGFYNALSAVIDYHGWPPARFEELTTNIDQVLPEFLAARGS